MSDKKNLDFDFLSKDTKTLSNDVDKEAPLSAPSDPATDVGFVKYFMFCFTDFSKFAKQHLAISKPKYLLLAVWVVGVGAVMDRIIGSSADYSDWGESWAIALLGGILSGALAYYVAGWFYNVRIKWSKGKGDIDTARHIYIFSKLPISITIILSFVLNQIVYADDYFYSPDATMIDMVFLLLFLVALFVSIRMGYKAAREVMEASKGRAIGWFIVAPIIFYAMVIFFGVLA